MQLWRIAIAVDIEGTGKLAFKMIIRAVVMYRVGSFSASTEPVSFKVYDFFWQVRMRHKHVIVTGKNRPR